MTISNDSEFNALAGPSVIAQRQPAANFCEGVWGLYADARVAAAERAAKSPGITDEELATISRVARCTSVERITQCGRETDWATRDGHFISRMATAGIWPPLAGDNLVRGAALDLRQAHTRSAIACSEGIKTRVAESQIRIPDAFLNQ